MKTRIKKTIQNLQRHNMGGYYVDTPEALLSLITTLLKEGDTVGCGDSLTLAQTGVFDFLRSGSYRFLDKHRPGLVSEEKREIYLQNFCVDTFFTGVNAVTTDGRLFNIDGNGSRVAPMLYGPRQVIVVTGTNKLADTLEAAIDRARQVAAPLDAKRLEKETPCAKLGRCVDCNHPQRICNDFVLIAGQFVKDRIKVIFIDGDYGF
ncbi:lactate utilization protein [Oscillospiraceae bacterium LTW-04]|nr:lactate utilization protein [Oscillospiraceae bacterium MB24-C1]